MSLQVGFPAEVPGSSLDDGVINRAASRLNEAVSRLEAVWLSSRADKDQSRLSQERRFEQHVQALTVQAAHWKGEAEKRAEEKTAALSAMRAQHIEDREKDRENDRESLQRSHAEIAQWREKAESWKEEARRSEEARVAAVHNSGSEQVKALASEASLSIDSAIAHMRSVLEKKKDQESKQKDAQG